MSFLTVFITASSVDEANRLADALVEESLAACVNIVGGCRSVYRWEGEVVHDDEVLLLAKTSRDRFSELERRVKELHSYDVPEIIGVELVEVSEGYSDFLRDALS